MTRTVAEMVGAGASDQSIADHLGGGVGRMAISRHRRNHIVAPARAVASMAAKGMDVAAQRSRTLAAAEAGDPSAYLALAAIVSDLRRTNERLERAAASAEQDNQRLAVASLSAQQLRATEVRAKMGGIGGYAPQAGRGSGDSPQIFSLNINFPGGRSEKVTLDMVPDAPDADRQEGPEGIGPGSEVDTLGRPRPALERLMAAFGGRSSV